MSIPGSVPPWPRIEAVAREDGTGEVIVDGTAQPIVAGNLDEVRVAIIRSITDIAMRLGRPVRVSTSGPDGYWPLIVHPTGAVTADQDDQPRPGRRATVNTVGSPSHDVSAVSGSVPTLGLTPGSPGRLTESAGTLEESRHAPVDHAVVPAGADDLGVADHGGAEPVVGTSYRDPYVPQAGDAASAGGWQGPSARPSDLARVAAGYQALTRATVRIPFDPSMVDGLLRYGSLKVETKRAWLAAAAAVARGL